MDQRKLHRILGLCMLLPLLAWATTGVVFLTKPGYEGAYERLPVKTYELGSGVEISPGQQWREIRLIKTVLGQHLLVKEAGATVHYDPDTLEPFAIPGRDAVRALIEDAIKINPERYGTLRDINELVATTDTEIEITLNWEEMTLSQRGADREIIETLYQIHYLKWTPWEGLNQLLGVLGLVLLTSLTIIGLFAYIKRLRENT